MKLSHSDTKRFIDFVLNCPFESARDLLFEKLTNEGFNEPALVIAIIKHGKSFKYSSDQWADFLAKFPNRLFRDEIWLMNKLSETQKQKLRLK